MNLLKDKKCSDKSILFVDSLIDEYKAKLSKKSNSINIYKEKIIEKEAIIILSNTKSDNFSVFSPNSREAEYDALELEIEEMKEKTDILNNEVNEIESDISQLEEIKSILSASKDSSQNNKGLNMLEIQEQDRQRIARDLHDSTVQNLTSLIHKSELCSRLVDTDPVRTRLELNTMSNILKSVINEIREIIYNLKPMSLEDLGLTITIERFINQLMMCHDIKIRFFHNDEKYDILPVIKLSLFRMIQEACNNAVKHSEATKIDIDLRYKNDLISVSVKDNGKGFDINDQDNQELTNYQGYGLPIMKERAILLSGTLDIDTSLAKGTIITINVPITICEGEEL